MIYTYWDNVRNGIGKVNYVWAKISDYCKVNKFKLNIDKSKVMITSAKNKLKQIDKFNIVIDKLIIKKSSSALNKTFGIC